MTPGTFAEVRDLFDRACDLDARARERLLDEEAARRPEVVARVRRLLEAGGREIDRVEATVADALGKRAGQVLGPYRLLELIGEGGMGEVWLAEQSAPIRRRVAVKMVKAGMDTRRVIARFEAERQALAMLSHPAVAAVLDAGETALGRPYFVMEHVDGPRIDRYCDAHRLDVAGRLRLFRQVCDGVQHAHNKTLIHRDLKPSNILVAAGPESPQPKIIDFGIARALAPSDDGRTRLTELGQPVGTPEYMSPEQLGPSDGAPDTRSDVYSLGVVLYELLTGTLPWSPRQASGRARPDRRADSAVVPTPSSRVARSDSLGELAASRGAQPRDLVRDLKGDLDWIVLKALEPDPERRYASPRELAEDLGRYLESRPVIARAPTPAYLAARFVRRHKAATTAAAAATASLVLGVVATTVAWQRALDAQAEARQEAETASQALEFVTGLFEAADPATGGRATADVFDLVERGAQKLASGSVEDPLVAARLASTVGDIYSKLSASGPGIEWLRRAYDEQVRLLGPDAPETLETAERMAFLYWGYGPVEEALDLQQRVVESRRRLQGPQSPPALRSQLMLGTILVRLGRGAEAEANARDVLAKSRATLGADSPLALEAGSLLSSALRIQGRDREAEPVLRDVVDARRRVLGVEHVDTAAAEQMLARLLVGLGRYDEAEGLLDALVGRVAVLFGPGHKAEFRTMSTYAYLRREQGRLQEALDLNRRVFEGFGALLRPGHPDLGGAARDLAETLVRMDRAAEAERVLLQVLAEEKRASGQLGPGAGPTVRMLSRIHAEWGRPELTDVRLAEL